MSDVAKKIAARIFKEMIFPVIVGIIWGANNYQKSNDPTLISVAGAFFSALAFAIYLQGQFLRVHKHVKDEKNHQGLTDGIADLRGRLDDIGNKLSEYASHGAPSSSSGPSSTPPDMMAFMTEAKSVAGSGHILPALLTAAVGFEQSLRRCAEIFDIGNYRSQVSLDSRGRPLSVSRIVREMEDRNIIDSNVSYELRRLISIRNSLVHASIGEIEQHSAEAASVISGFEWGVEYLNRVSSEPQ